MTRPPVPPFSREDAILKVRMAEDAWNGRDPARVAMAYTPDTVWRNRSDFLHGHDQVQGFLVRKWQAEQEYRLIKALWCHAPDAWRCGSAMNGTMPKAGGFGPTATRTGSSTRAA